MGRDSIKAIDNPCFRCRKAAAKYDERLYSRDGAAELLGVSVSSLAEYETGATKVIPVDKIVLMADLYKAPELKVWYCSEECPIGRGCTALPSYEINSIERTTLGLLKLLKQEDVKSVTDTLLDIASDGEITADEHIDLAEIIEYLDDLIKVAGELKLIGAKALKGGGHE